MKRKIKVDLVELAIALDSSSYEMRYFLDLETGDILLISGEFDYLLEEIYEEVQAEGGLEAVSVEERVRELDYPEWQKEVLLDAHRVEQGYGERYIRIESDDPYAGYNDMEQFIGTVADPELRDRVWRAIHGRGAFRRFKDLLARHPDLREEWFEFADAQSDRRLAEWLQTRDIEPI
jgi:hypothetical protein